MKNLEELGLELKNDIFSEIRENKNWDVIEYTMRFDSSGSGQGGLIILFKNSKEIERVVHKKWSDFWYTTKDLINSKKINKGTLIIYPNGAYESSFIWDEEAHLSGLIGGVDSLLSYVCEELFSKIPTILPPHTVIDWREFTVIIPFIEGQIQPLQIRIKAGEAITALSILIEDIRYEKSLWLVAQFEEMYQLTNEGELKGILSEKWNTIIIRNTVDGFDFDKGVSFEWKEENA